MILRIVLLMTLIGLASCSPHYTEPTGLKYWLIVASFAFSLISGLVVIVSSKDENKAATGLAGVVFLIVALILLFS